MTNSENECVDCRTPLLHPLARRCKECKRKRHNLPARRGKPKPKLCENPACGRMHTRGADRAFCSCKCRQAIQNKSVLRKVAKAERTIARIIERLSRPPVPTPEQSLLARLEKTALERAAMVRTCPCCGNDFVPRMRRPSGTYNSVGAIGKLCYTCRAITDRIKRYGAAYEVVNSLSVFERDGWKCQHCGAITPKELYGKSAPTAPTLDHILPLSCGGAHSYANTQDLCWACNSRKRNIIALEPRLAGVLDLTPFRVALIPACPCHGGQPLLQHECKCGCGRLYTPFLDGNAEYSNGHWKRAERLARTALRARLLLTK